MKDGGLMLWNAGAMCEMFKTSWQTGKLRMKDDVENHFKGPIIFIGAMVEYHPIFSERSIKNSSIWQEGITWYLSGL